MSKLEAVRKKTCTSSRVQITKVGIEVFRRLVTLLGSLSIAKSIRNIIPSTLVLRFFQTLRMARQTILMKKRASFHDFRGFPLNVPKSLFAAVFCPDHIFSCAAFGSGEIVARQRLCVDGTQAHSHIGLDSHANDRAQKQYNSI